MASWRSVYGGLMKTVTVTLVAALIGALAGVIARSLGAPPTAAFGLCVGITVGAGVVYMRRHQK